MDTGLRSILLMLKTIRYKVWMLLAVVAGCELGSYAAAAETYPIKPVRLIAAFSPGGFVDLTARLVSGPLSARSASRWSSKS